MIQIYERSRRRVHGVLFKLPGMITCNEFEGFVLAYLNDELSPKQRRLFKVHLMVCSPCRKYLAAYRRTLNATAILKEEDVQELSNVPEDLVAAILATRANLRPEIIDPEPG